MTAEPQRPSRLLLRLLGYARPYLGIVALSVAFSLAYAGGLTGRVYLIRPLLDDVAFPSISVRSFGEVLEQTAPQAETPAEHAEAQKRLQQRVDSALGQVFVWAILLILGMPLVHWVRDYSSEWVMTRLLADMQAQLGSKLLRLPLSRHQQESSGEFVARTVNDTYFANRVQSLVFGEGLQDVAIVLVSLVGMLYLNWRLALVTLLGGPVIALVLQLFGDRIRRSSMARQEQMSEVVQRLVRILSGIKVIKAFRSEQLEADAFDREIARFFRRSMRVIRNRVMSRSVVELVTQAGFVALLLVGVYAVVQNFWDLTIGGLAAFLGLSAMQYRPLKNLTRLYNAIQDGLPAGQRVFEVLDAAEETADAADAVELERVARGIRFRDVWFSYGREPVLCGVDLEIAAGEVVALVGRTGAGKTTLTDVLLRFHDPDRGSVEIDGIDLRRLRRDSLRELIAVVTQEHFLFDTTILENIRFGRPDATLEEVIEAAHAANAHEFIAGLDNGYQTLVGEIGGQLSGGQRQRVTIARALLRDPQILVFDEATSALDARSQRLVQEAIANLMKGRTVLLIAHRLQTVRAAHRIVVIEGGRVSQTGTHDELYARGGLYRELVDLELSDPQSPA